MKARLSLLCAALLLISIAHRATDYRKMSGHVKGVVVKQEQKANASRSLIPHTSYLLPQTSRLTAFVRIDDADADEVWNTYGCKPYAHFGDNYIVGIPLDAIGALSDHPAVRRIEASPSGFLSMDTTAIIIGANKVQDPMGPIERSRSSIPHPTLNNYTGKGVVVGVMDVGFDLTHPNFLDPVTGNSRISAFWDQLTKDTVGSTMPVGRDYLQPTALNIQHSADGLLQTHGTHTLGIAAGGGYHSPYKGIAFDSDICIVSNAISESIALIDSADYYKYTTATDALGFKYIFDYADQQGKPAVASLSEGYPPYIDEEDSLYAAFLDSLSGPGRIIVAAAGNESTSITYAEKPRGIDAAGAFLSVSRDAAYYRIKSDGSLNISVYAYAKGSEPSDTLHYPAAAIPVDSLRTDTLFLRGDTCTVMIASYPTALTSSTEADSCYIIYFLANKNLTELPPIALVMEGAEARGEIYGSSIYGLTNRSTDSRWNAATSGHNVHAPACFPSVICVGSTAHRLGFTNYKGQYKDYSYGRTRGQLSPYSSIGPAMNGLMKPQVTAPGDNIISSYSSFYIEANPDANDINSDVEHFDYQGRTYAWNANTGTSMATPVVAGVIALWLEAKPDLTPQEVIDALSHTSRHPDSSLTYPNNQYGYGEIDAYSGLLHILGASRIEGVSHHQPQSLHITFSNGQLQLTCDTPPAAPLHVSIYSLSGTLLHESALPSSLNSYLIPLTSYRSGLYIVQVTSSAPQYVGSQVITIKTKP